MSEYRWISREVKPTFSSSSFFSLRFLRLRAVSSRRSAISVSVSDFFFLEDGSSGGQGERG